MKKKHRNEINVIQMNEKGCVFYVRTFVRLYQSRVFAMQRMCIRVYNPFTQ